MKSRIYKILIIAIAIGIIMMAGCKKDFLTIKPIDKVTELTYYSDTNNILSAVAGAYNSFEYKENLDAYEQYRMFLGSISSDEAECGGDTPTAWAEGYLYDILGYDATGLVLSQLYGAMYAGISRSSEIIQYMPAMRQISGIDTANLNRHLGEAYFLRAAYHFVLCRTFGGVPVVDHVLGANEVYTINRGTVKDVFNQMEKDLKVAINYLPLEGQWPGGQTDEGRATKGAAQALLAKMYVYESSYNQNYGTSDVRLGAVQNRWTEALAMCENLINSNVYQLVGINGEKYSTFWDNGAGTTNGFRYLFSVEGNNNKESVFAVQHALDQNGYNVNRGTALNQFVGARAVYYDKAMTQLSTENAHCWGFWVPTHKLFNIYDSLDVRRKVTISQKGDSVYCAPDSKPKGWYYIVPTQFPATGFECNKYEIGPHLAQFQGLYWQANPQNSYYIRYADVILLAAEAAMNSGDPDGKAETYFNMIRKRARMCGNGINPIDLSGKVTQQDIMDERLREFAMEGERFFDLVRWHQAKAVLDNMRMEWWDSSVTTTVSYIEPKYELLPITSYRSS